MEPPTGRAGTRGDRRYEQAHPLRRRGRRGRGDGGHGRPTRGEFQSQTASRLAKRAAWPLRGRTEAGVDGWIGPLPAERPGFTGRFPFLVYRSRSR
jgi:hypothetical protein